MACCFLLPQESAHFGRGISPGAAGRRDVLQAPLFRPPANRFGSDTKQLGDDADSVKLLRFVTFQELGGTVLGVSAVATDRPNVRELALFCPSGNRLGGDAKHRGNLSGSEQFVVL